MNKTKQQNNTIISTSFDKINQYDRNRLDIAAVWLNRIKNGQFLCVTSLLWKVFVYVIFGKFDCHPRNALDYFRLTCHNEEMGFSRFFFFFVSYNFRLNSSNPCKYCNTMLEFCFFFHTITSILLPILENYTRKTTETIISYIWERKKGRIKRNFTECANNKAEAKGKNLQVNTNDEHLHYWTVKQ